MILMAAVWAGAGIAQAQEADGSFKALNADGLRAFMASQQMDVVQPQSETRWLAAVGAEYPIMLALEDCSDGWCATLRLETAFQTTGSVETLAVLLQPDYGPGNLMAIDDMLGEAKVTAYREVALGGRHTFGTLGAEVKQFKDGLAGFRLKLAKADPQMAWLAADLLPSE